MTVRIATWNMQAAFGQRKIEDKWRYFEDRIAPDVGVLTEAGATPGTEYALDCRSGGLGKGYPWGTIVATRPPFQSVETPTVSYRFKEYDLYQTSPGSVVVCDIYRDGARIVTVAGVYAVTRDGMGEKVGHGRETSRMIAADLEPLFKSRRDRGVILAGDLNAWPEDAARSLRSTTLIDLVEETRDRRPASPSCVCRSEKPCHHIWTHNNSFAGKFQQIDFLMATPDVAERLESLAGGPEAFPDIWEHSDHAPLVVELDL